MSNSATLWVVAPLGSSVHGDSPGKNTAVGCHFLLQGIFLTQESNPHLLHWQGDSLPLSHQGSLAINATRETRELIGVIHMNEVEAKNFRACLLLLGMIPQSSIEIPIVQRI